jgi:hypothetical protein
MPTTGKKSILLVFAEVSLFVSFYEDIVILENLLVH